MSLVFDVKVVPSSGRKEWKLDKSTMLKCYVKSHPEQGKANAELIKDLARLVGVIQEEVTIVAGTQSRKKKIRIETTITYDALLELLGIVRQMNLFS